MRLPNPDTAEALRQARDGEDLTEYATLEELKAREAAERTQPASAEPADEANAVG